jgi:predicted Ser/Thr protein kinase
MSDEKKCGLCGAPLTAGTPEGLCPACLLKRALDTQTAGGGLGADFTPPPPEDLARFFPQLEILELLGRGGMGVVYKARQRDLDRIVALKILPSATDRDPAFAERFAREARALARLAHPNIVAIYESGQTGGLFYFVMEYVDGLNLRQLLAAAKMTPREALAIVPQICEALQTAHDQGIVHRDIKPENILLDKKGRVKIADFGIAKIVGGDEKDMTLTGAGEMMGTPAYMAPEQIEHPLEVDHRADIYSLGVVFYQMLTGELPLGKFAPPSRIRGMQIDVRLDEVVLRALEKEPDLRYQQASEVRTQVETIAGSPKQDRPVATTLDAALLNRVRWQMVGYGFLMAVAAVALGLGGLSLNHGILTGFWGVFMFLVIAIAAFDAGDNLEKIKVLRLAVILDSIVIYLLGIRWTVETSILSNLWNITICTAFLGGLIWSAIQLQKTLSWPIGSALLGESAFRPGSTANTPPVDPARLSRIRWHLLFYCFLMAVGALVMGINVTPEPYGIMIGCWGVLFFAAAAALAFTAGESPEKIKALHQVTAIDSIGIFAAAMKCALITPGLPTPWIIPIVAACAYGIISGVFKLANWRPWRSQLFARTLSAPSQLASLALFFSGLSGALAWLTFGLIPHAPAILVWSILVAAVAGIVPSIPARAHWFGKLALLIGVIDANAAIWLILGPSQTGMFSGGPAPELVQDFTTDIHADGTVHVLSTFSERNRTGAAVDQDEFNSSNCFHWDKMTDGHGWPLRYTEAAGSLDRTHYVVALNEPVPPDGMITVTSEGNVYRLLKATGEPGEFEYDFDQSPGYDGVTHRIETHRLPPGAELIDKGPQDMKVDHVGDHIELHLDYRVPPGSDIDIRFRYRLASANLQRNLNSATPSNNPVQNGGDAEETVSEITKAAPEPVEQILEEYDWSALAAAGRVNPGMLAGIGGYQMFLVTNTTDAAMQWPVLKIDKPPITSMHYALTGEIKYDGVQGAGYLEMWSYFPPAGPGQPEGQFFSRTLGRVGSGPMARITGTSDWRTFELPFDHTGLANPPTRLEVNIFLPGRGVVFIDSLKLTQLLEAKETQASAASPESSGTSH